MKRTKQGVSLIVLVITIIIMIILASTIIVTLSNSDIIDRANEAVEKTDVKEVQNIAMVAWSEAYLDGKTTKAELQTAVESALSKNKVDMSKYNIEVTKKGVTVKLKIAIPEDWKASVREITEDGVPIPMGFVKSPYAGEGTKDGGLVIYALTETEITEGKTTITDAHQTALENRNQFVWVPVDSNNFETLFRRQDFINTPSKISYKLGTNYWELVLTANNMPADSTKKTTDYVSAATLLEATKMYESVKKYGGFYIARYEVGSKETYNDTTNGYIATRATKDNISNLSITMGKYPYNAVAWGTSLSNETSDDRAVSLAREFYPSDETTYGVVSTLTYGVQWDRTLAWWEEQDALDGEDNLNLTNSTAYGVYSNTTIASADLNAGAKYSIYASSKYGTWSTITEKASSGSWLLTTGAYKKANVYNIYDMAGNLYEWTMEGYAANLRVLRGGYFDRSGSDNPVAIRSYNSPAVANFFHYGFRPSLYIK